MRSNLYSKKLHYNRQITNSASFDKNKVIIYRIRMCSEIAN